MTNNTDKKDQKKNDPFWQDELDVYEAILKLEEEKGEKILTEEKRRKLLEAREHLSEFNQESTDKVSLKSAESDPEKAADMMIYAMRRSVKSLLIEKYKYCSLEEWEKKDGVTRRKVINLFFYLIYGIREDKLRERLVDVFEGKEVE
jgi:hypothetical protein